MAATLTESEVAAGLVHALQTAREECKQPDVQLQTLLVLLTLAREGGETTMQQVGDEVGLSQSAVSRQVSKLGQGTFREPGLGFVEAYEDPQWRRRKLVRLTASGKVTVKNILAGGVKWFNARRG